MQGVHVVHAMTSEIHRPSPTHNLLWGLVEGGGFEPPKASPTDLQSVPFGRSGTPPLKSALISLEPAEGLEPPAD